eukprot:8777833-Alexandrium_andersonii.AAC.1
MAIASHRCEACADTVVRTRCKQRKRLKHCKRRKLCAAQTQQALQTMQWLHMSQTLQALRAAQSSASGAKRWAYRHTLQILQTPQNITNVASA